MTVLLHLSDTHFGTEQPPVLEALVALAAQLRPDVAVLSGDITQRGQTAQYRAARAFVERLGVPLLALPGNHDIALFDLAARLFRPYAVHCAMFGDELEPVWASPEWLLLCVNTTRWWRHKNGEVSPAQVERVAARLAGAEPGQLRVVVVHQPVAVTRMQDLPNRLRGSDAALARWAAAGADLVLGGHIHLPYVMPLPGLARPMWAVQAGTAVSSRTRAGVPNSVNVLRWGAVARGDGVVGTRSDVGSGAHIGRCIIEQWDYAAGPRAFQRRLATDIQPARGSDAV